ncbi:hypothetical protein GCM10023331_40350 [Algivirga pacifica]|uniref:Cyclic nucleotide-binding domain-containing protein n=2 Tax=Algivirga pacifica TaxID=1162670 RepID=A0ABP9DMS8_9BACT
MEDEILEHFITLSESPLPYKGIYAYSELLQINPSLVQQIVQEVLSKKDHNMQIPIIRWIQQERILELKDSLLPILDQPTDQDVRIDVLQAAIDSLLQLSNKHTYKEHIPQLQKWLESSYSLPILQILVRYDILPLQEQVNEKIDNLLESDSLQDIIIAIKLIAQSPKQQYTTTLDHLIQHPNRAVRKQAIKATGQLQSPHHIPVLMQLLQGDEMTKEAIDSLSAYGSAALEAIDHALTFYHKSNPNMPLYLCRVLGNIGGSKAQEILWRIVTFPWKEVQNTALIALRKSIQVLDNEQTFYLITDHIERKVKQISWIYTALKIIDGQKSYHYLFQALEDEARVLQHQIGVLYNILKQHISEIPSFSSLGSKVDELRREQDLLSDDNDQLLQHLLPKDLSQKLMIIEGFYSLEEKQKKLDFYYNNNLIDELSITSTILKPSNVKNRGFSRWTIAMTLHVTFDIATPKIMDYFSYYLNSNDWLLIEPALDRLKRYSHFRGFDIASLLKEFVSPTRYNLLMNILNESVKPLTQIEKVLLLKSTRLFSQLSESYLTEIAELLTEVKLTQGEKLFEKGAFLTGIYIIYEGEVLISKSAILKDTLIDRDFFGTLSVLDNQPVDYSAYIIKDAILLKINREDFLGLLEQRPEIMKYIIQLVCSKLRQKDQLSSLY